MFWLRNKKSNFQLRTLIWGSDRLVPVSVVSGLQRVDELFFTLVLSTYSEVTIYEVRNDAVSAQRTLKIIRLIGLEQKNKLP